MYGWGYATTWYSYWIQIAEDPRTQVANRIPINEGLVGVESIR